MGRTVGATNADHADRRRELATAVLFGLVDDEGTPATLRGLARACGVTVPTLKHYFDDYDGAVRAALAEAEQQGRIHLEHMAKPGRKRLPASMRAAAAFFVDGWAEGVGLLFNSSLTHGLGNAARGPAVVNHVLEPSLQSVEARLSVHQARGELRDEVDLRVAALAFVSPLLLAMLHQHGLGGVACRPLDVEGAAQAHVDAWLRAYAAGPAA